MVTPTEEEIESVNKAERHKWPDYFDEVDRALHSLKPGDSRYPVFIVWDDSKNSFAATSPAYPQMLANGDSHKLVLHELQLMIVQKLLKDKKDSEDGISASSGKKETGSTSPDSGIEVKTPKELDSK